MDGSVMSYSYLPLAFIQSLNRTPEGITWIQWTCLGYPTTTLIIKRYCDSLIVGWFICLFRSQQLEAMAVSWMLSRSSEAIYAHSFVNTDKKRYNGMWLEIGRCCILLHDLPVKEMQSKNLFLVVEDERKQILSSKVEI